MSFLSRFILATTLALTSLASSAHARDAKPATADAKAVTVFAAASMKNALDEVDAAYTAKSGVRIVARIHGSRISAILTTSGMSAGLWSSRVEPSVIVSS